MWSCWGEAISSGLGVPCICQYQATVEEMCIRDSNGGIRVNLHEVRDVGCVIRIHMLYDKIIRLALAQNLLDVIEPLDVYKRQPQTGSVSYS